MAKRDQNTYTIAVSVIVLAVVLVSGITPTSGKSSPTELIAQTQILPNDCQSMEIVFLIDQSEKIAEDNDPEGLRSTAVKFMIGAMGYDRLFACPDVNHRFAVINVEDSVSGRLPSMVAVNPSAITWVSAGDSGSGSLESSINTWNTQFVEKTSNINAYSHDDDRSSGGFAERDIESAFDQAIEILETSREAQPEASSLKQAIILISAQNAAPCPDDTKPCYISTAEEYLKDSGIKSELDDQGAPYMYVLAFPYSSYETQNARGADVRLENLWREYVQNEDGYGGFYQLTDNTQILPKLMDIYTQLNPGYKITPVIGSVDVPPFQDSAEFLIFNTNQDLLINPSSPIDYISQPVGNLNLEYRVYTLPKPGQWTIDWNGDGNTTMFVHFTPAQNLVALDLNNGLALPQYQEDNAVSDPNQPFKLEIQLLSKENNPILEYEDYPASINGTLSLPNGAGTKPLTFIFDRSKEAYITTEPLPVNFDADYMWTVTFESGGLPAPLTIEGQYSVRTVIPFSMRVKLPEEIPTLHGTLLDDKLDEVNLIKVEVELYRTDSGDKLDPGSIIKSDMNKAILVKLIHTSTNTNEDVLLSYNANDQIFRGDVGQIDKLGQYSIVPFLDPNAEYSSDFRLSPNLEQPNYFDRKDTLLTTPFLYMATLSIMAMAVIIAVFSGIRSITHTVPGSLGFSRIGSAQPFAVLPLDRKRRRVVRIKGSDLRDCSKLLWPLEALQARLSPDGDSIIDLTISHRLDTGELSIDNIQLKPGGEEPLIYDKGIKVKYFYNPDER